MKTVNVKKNSILSKLYASKVTDAYKAQWEITAEEDLSAISEAIIEVKVIDYKDASKVRKDGTQKQSLVIKCACNSRGTLVAATEDYKKEISFWVYLQTSGYANKQKVSAEDVMLYEYTNKENDKTFICATLPED